MPELPASSPPPLFAGDTRRQAGAVAALTAGSRKARIIELLQERGSLTLFEAAEAMNVGDNQISGRFTDLAKDGLIRDSGQRRRKPGTDCDAVVWVLAEAAVREETILDKLGYPPTLMLNTPGCPPQVLERGELLDREPTPGIPYSVRPAAGEARMHWRLEFIESPCCGQRLLYAPEQIAGKEVKRFKCVRCTRTYELATAAEPGRSPALVMVMKTLS
jgi:hypothetical protein